MCQAKLLDLIAKRSEWRDNRRKKIANHNNWHILVAFGINGCGNVYASGTNVVDGGTNQLLQIYVLVVSPTITGIEELGGAIYIVSVFK